MTGWQIFGTVLTVAVIVGIMQATWRLYDRPCPAVGCQYHAARDGAWLVCAGGHRMRARLR